MSKGERMSSQSSKLQIYIGAERRARLPELMEYLEGEGADVHDDKHPGNHSISKLFRHLVDKEWRKMESAKERSRKEWEQSMLSLDYKMDDEEE
jgi:hypothetical protein